ncbi:MAG: VTC domain-containing protein, partial [Nakamurella sp.]
KERLEYHLADRRLINDIACAYLESRGLSAGIIRELAPTLTTTYHRSTLLDNDGARYTIDAGLHCAGTSGTAASVGDGVFLETKAPGAATPLDRLLWSWGHRPVSVSKYCSGLAALTPGLPANKWNRTLRKHYGWQPATPDTHSPRR